jgi:hypothetical protein
VISAAYNSNGGPAGEFQTFTYSLMHVIASIMQYGARNRLLMRPFAYLWLRLLSCNVGPNSSLLDAFFYGKAFAETLNEKLGAALDDALATIGKQDAERREAFR